MTSKILRWLSVPAMLVVVALDAPVAPAQVAGRLIGNPQAAPLGLETMWSTFVRVDPARGRVRSLQLIHGLLLAQTDQGTVQAIHPETGRTLWSAELGSPQLTTMPPGANDKFVAVTNGSTLYLLDRSSGAVRWQHRVSGSPSAGCALNDDRVWVPLDNGIIEAYLLERREGYELIDGIPKRYASSSGALVSPLVEGKRCSWSVSEGFVYSAEETFKDLKQFRFRVDDDLSIGPAAIAPHLFAASRRGTVFALSNDLGNEVWRFSIGDSVSHPLVTIDGALYVISETGSMVRLDPSVGRQVWFGRGVKRFLAAGADRLYLLDQYDRLTVRDAATGSQFGAAPTAGFDLPCYNDETDRIYLASTTGLVQCLRESRQIEPLKHTSGAPAAKPAEGAAPAAQPAEGTAPATPAAPATNNPFGTP